MAGIYIHIPFCASRCIYCGFYSTTGKGNLQDKYVDALLKEFSSRRDYLTIRQAHQTKREKVHTIYIGGGTPSLLSEKNLRKIHDGIYDAVKDDGIEEFTMECNPDDISPALSKLLKEIGVTRVSMGAQTFNDNILKFLRRRHKASQIPSAVKTLRDAGIENISIDLMFGFSGFDSVGSLRNRANSMETLEDWEEDIDAALSLGVEHISAYSLMYEEGTVLYKQKEAGLIKELDEEISVKMYDMLIDKLTAAGYEHYEISNFAKPGYRSKHNSSYWDGTHYIGLGAAAHSYDGKTRGWNVSDIGQYIAGTPPEVETLDEDTRYNDLITTALRTREGIDLSHLQPKYYNYIIRNAREGINAGLLKIDGEHLHLTRKGLYISDDVMSDLIYLE